MKTICVGSWAGRAPFRWQDARLATFSGAHSTQKGPYDKHLGSRWGRSWLSEIKDRRRVTAALVPLAVIVPRPPTRRPSTRLLRIDRKPQMFAAGTPARSAFFPRSVFAVSNDGVAWLCVMVLGPLVVAAGMPSTHKDRLKWPPLLGRFPLAAAVCCALLFLVAFFDGSTHTPRRRDASKGERRRGGRGERTSKRRRRRLCHWPLDLAG